MRIEMATHPDLIDPDPFTMLSLFVALAGSAGSIAAVVLQQRQRSSDNADTQGEARADLIAACDLLEEELRWLIEVADRIERFLRANSRGRYSLSNTRFGLTSLAPDLGERELDQYLNIKTELAKHCTELFRLEVQILKLLARFPVDLSEDSARRSERFREKLRLLTSGGISYNRALTLMRQVSEEGHRFADDLRDALR